MPLRTTALALTITIGFLARAASAQDDPRVGITMGYPASIGAIWQMSDAVALRPEFGVSTSASDLTATTSLSTGTGTTTTSSQITNDSWQLSVGVSALFYLSKHDALRTYVSPRWAYTRTSSTSSGGVPSGSASGSTGNGHLVSGSFGAQYALARRFSVFGEVGLGYSYTTNAPTASGSAIVFTASSGWNLTTRSGAGVVLYF